MTMTDTPLFEVEEFYSGSGPRTRKSDPIQSHLAADRSQRTMHATKRAVLLLVQHHGELSGSELNDMYQLRAALQGWGKVSFDTPRKRAGELAEDGYLTFRTQTSDGNHLDEKVYSITAKGRAALVSGGVLR